MKDDILDQKPTTKHNPRRMVPIGRGVVSGLLAAGIFNTLFRRPQYHQPELDSAYAFGLFLPIIIYAWWIYYKLRQIKANRTTQSSAFGKPALADSLLIGLAYAYLNLTRLSNTDFVLNTATVTPILALLGGILMLGEDINLWRKL